MVWEPAPLDTGYFY